MVKTVLSNFSIFALITEIKEKIKDGWMAQAYQLDDDNVFLFRIRTKRSGTLTLLVQPGIRLHLTNYDREKPQVPSKFCMNVLRKHLKNLRILDIYQFNFDRICVLELGKIIRNDDDSETRQLHFKLVFEFFKYGTLTLLNEEEVVVSSLRYKQMRDRRIIPNRPYEFALSRGFNFLNVSLEDLKSTFDGNEDDILRILINNLNIGPIYSEEICIRSGIADLKRPGKSISEDEIKLIFEKIIEMRNFLLEKSFTPIIVKENDENYDVIPIDLQYYDDENYSKSSEHEEMNEAADEFYSLQEKTIDHKEITEIQGVKQTKLSKTQRILEEQQNKIDDMKISIEKYRKYGDLIYQHFQTVEELLKTVNEARQNNVEWDEILNRIELGKQKGIPAAQIVKKIIPKEALLQLTLNDETITVDFRYGVTETAERFYKKSKKERSKLKGAEYALLITQKKLKKAKTDVEEVQDLKAETIQKKRKKKWYENFHWTYSSDGFLLVGGKDAKTNEILTKRYKEKDDLFVHAVFQGASSVIIKTEGKEVSERTFHEAAGITISYSSAWKSSYAAADAYWVESDQVSFSPPSGEYLVHGSFIIKGKKHLIKGIPLEIKIGVIIDEIYAIPVMGIGNSLNNKAKFIVTLKVGNTKSSDISKHIKKHWIDKISKEEDEENLRKIKKIKIEEIQHLIPSGKAQLFFQ